MKKFYSEKELAKYLNVSLAYIKNELFNFLGCQGSEIFDNEQQININSFKYEGFKVNDKTVFVASIKIDDKEIERYKVVYYVAEKEEV